MQSGIHAHSHHRYIDCVRGYAILLVLAAHVTYAFIELPYPVKRLTSSGWFGVQMFFLASALTLMMSWHAELQKHGIVSIRGFFIRRFMRIAPAYYAAGLLYFLLIPPQSGFDSGQALKALLFVNAWNPDWTSTTGRWIVVPGGWSISVEFSFYLVFPCLALIVTNLRRALLSLLASLALGAAANLVAWKLYQIWFNQVSVQNFLFFWFPNQMSVFMAGFVFYFLLRDHGAMSVWVRGFFARHAQSLSLAAVAGFAALAYIPQGHYLGDRPWIPAGQAICVPFMVFILAISCGRSMFVNKIAALLGTVSFSAYLIHFAILHILMQFPESFHLKQTGFAAIAAFLFLYGVTVVLTFGIALVSYTWIEQPMIALARIWQRRVPSPAATSR